MAAGVELTDSLPDGVTFAKWVQRPSGTTGSNNQITWGGTVAANQAITFSFVTTHTGGLYGEVISNTAVYSHTSGNGEASATFIIEPDPAQALPVIIFLPLLLKDN